MPEIIEYICTQGETVTPLEERQTFTVDLTKLDVPINAPAGNAGKLRGEIIGGAPIGAEWFSANDNVQILGLAVTLPYQFTLSTNAVKVVLGWFDQDGANGPVTQVGGGGEIWVPTENVDFGFNVFVPAPSPGKSWYFLALLNGSIDPAQQLRISMINAPSSLDGLTLPVTVLLKVLHNIPLKATP